MSAILYVNKEREGRVRKELAGEMVPKWMPVLRPPALARHGSEGEKQL